MTTTPGQRVKQFFSEIQALVDYALSMEQKPAGMSAKEAVDEIDSAVSKIACYAAMISAELNHIPIFVAMGSWAAAIMEIETGQTFHGDSDMDEILAQFNGPIN